MYLDSTETPSSDSKENSLYFDFSVDIVDPFSINFPLALKLSLEALSTFSSTSNVPSEFLNPIFPNLSSLISNFSQSNPVSSPSDALNLLSASLLLDSKLLLYCCQNNTELISSSHFLSQAQFDLYISKTSNNCLLFDSEEAQLTLTISRIFRPLLLDLLSRCVSPSTKPQVMRLLNLDPSDPESVSSYTFCVFYTFSFLFPLYPQAANLFQAFFDSVLYPCLPFFFNNSTNNTLFLLSNLLSLYRTYPLAKNLSPTFSSCENNRITNENISLTNHNSRYNSGNLFSPINQSNSVDSLKLVASQKNNSSLSPSFLCELVIPVYGVLLSGNLSLINQDSNSVNPQLQLTSPSDSTSEFIPTSSSKKALVDLALALSLHQPVLLSGISGSGKSTFIEHIAKLTGNDLITIHLGDQTDPKVLLGTYVSGAVQGDFEWQPGVLSLAVEHGKWVLIEDINSASNEVASILLPLLESRELFIPGRGERIPAHNRFQILATQTISLPTNIQKLDSESKTNNPSTSQNQTSSSSFGLLPTSYNSHIFSRQSSISSNGCWNHILVNPLSSLELEQIISFKYKNLASISNNLVNLFFKIQNLSSQSVSSLASELALHSSASISSNISAPVRKLNNRDFFKFCKRVSYQLSLFPVYRNNGADLLNNPDGRFLLFSEASDCFFESESLIDIYSAKLHYLATLIGVSKDRVNLFISSFVPQTLVSPKNLVVGRATISLNLDNSSIFKQNPLLEEFFSNPSDISCLLKFWKSLSASNHFDSLDAKSNSQSVSKPKPFSLTDCAKRLLEKILLSVELNEPVLLSGETGTGKTTVVQYASKLLNKQLGVVNLSQQSDSSDLLGGFKPLDIRSIALSLKNSFENLFSKTFSKKKNVAFIDAVRISFSKKSWSRLSKLFTEASKMANLANLKKEEKILAKLNSSISSPATDSYSNSPLSSIQDFENSHSPSKKLKLDSNLSSSERTQLLSQLEQQKVLKFQWDEFSALAHKFSIQVQSSADNNSSSSMIFSYKEGILVDAVKNGHWILLDEINLATPETLDCLSGLLQDINGSILLVDRGDIHPIKRHPDFRLFACMNPATDVGKKSLPVALRSRFSEYYVHPPDNHDADLLSVINTYLAPVLNLSPQKQIPHHIKDFYRKARSLSNLHKIVDGAQQRPNYSLRTLTRALSFAAANTSTFQLQRSVYEGLYMTFATQLESESRSTLVSVLQKCIFPNLTSSAISKLLSKASANPPQLSVYSSFVKDSYSTSNKKSNKAPFADSGLQSSPTQNSDTEYIKFGPYWLRKAQKPPSFDHKPIDYKFDEYVLTDSVVENLHALSRAVMCGEYPVLIQGPTSAGKTSMIEYLAHKTEHTFVRVNNHEHTDLQEYLGSYISKNGKLVFQEGVLVRALRHGHWIVLDELNLAPSDVLEALNRLLDDNRELYIPETSETVKPHPDFMLFATQNPAGLYGGRKHLSRAFRNRFLELHFDQMPKSEIDQILTTKCKIAPSHSKKLVQVYSLLTEIRSQSRLFEAQNGFITLRDLFRWANRGATTQQELANVGYMLLGERVRKPSEKLEIKSVLEKVFRSKIDPLDLYSAESLLKSKEYQNLMEAKKRSESNRHLIEDVVWTFAMRRLFILTSLCLSFNDPVLLVGETGCGKTTVCQLLAIARGTDLCYLNCHQNTETADLLGGQRPVRNRSFLNSQLKINILLLFQQLSLLNSESVTPISTANLDLLRQYPNFSQLLSLLSSHTTDNGVELETLASDSGFTSSFMNHLSLFISQDIRSNPLDLSLIHPEVLNVLKSAQLCMQYYQNKDNLFEWVDGPLVTAMKSGSLFLLDEISLADDSVLERLNSVLEPSRTLLLAEKSSDSVAERASEDSFESRNSTELSEGPSQNLFDQKVGNIDKLSSLKLVAASGFEFMATMNPGGDYGKRELSPALRNRFVEVWVPSVTNRFDLLEILETRMVNSLSKYQASVSQVSPGGGKISLQDPDTQNATNEWASFAAKVIVDYMKWLSDLITPPSNQYIKNKALSTANEHSLDTDAQLGEDVQFNLLSLLSLREYLSWADFVAKTKPTMGANLSIVHGGCLVLLDGFGSHGSASGKSAAFINSFRPPQSRLFSSLNNLDNKKKVKLYLVETLLYFSGISSIKGDKQTIILNSTSDVLPSLSQLFGIIESGYIIKFDLPSTILESTQPQSISSSLLEHIKFKTDNTNAGLLSCVGVDPFYIERNASDTLQLSNNLGFALHAPTSFDNFVKILRGMQIKKPILLEGSPGVGKTTLVETLAKLSGHKLERINLSDQTDLMDLFGTDLPIENGEMGQFEWRDAPFLKAMQNGDWVLLDEINLATQSVLEGLNSCLDHRGTVFISELGKEFTRHPNFFLFAAQNPVGQGGGRKGLPKSFLSRFTQVFMSELSDNDMEIICLDKFEKDNISLEPGLLQKVLKLNNLVNYRIHDNSTFGRLGAPWEFNLRDIYRLFEFARLQFNFNSTSNKIQFYHLVDFLRIVYVDRMRSHEDREEMWKLIYSTFVEGDSDSTIAQYISSSKNSFTPIITSEFIQIGSAFLGRKGNYNSSLQNVLHLFQIEGDSKDQYSPTDYNKIALLDQNLGPLSSLIHCVRANQMAIVVGNSGAGKSSMVQFLANSSGQRLLHFSMNTSIDTLELLGGFEKTDLHRHWLSLVNSLKSLVSYIIYEFLISEFDLDDYSKSPQGPKKLIKFENQLANSNATNLEIQNLSKKTYLLRTQVSSDLDNLIKNVSSSSMDISQVDFLVEVVDYLIGVKTENESVNSFYSKYDSNICNLFYSLSNRSQILSQISPRIENLKIQISLYKKMCSAGVLGRFEFIDGVLIEALMNGYWILIDKSNLCSPSVLDRLNGLLEPNGKLVLGECGIVNDSEGNQTVRTIKKHENFRIFLTVDPAFGEMSRAMRNRGIEIAILPPNIDSSSNFSEDHSRLLQDIHTSHTNSKGSIYIKDSDEPMQIDQIGSEVLNQSVSEELVFGALLKQICLYPNFKSFIKVSNLYKISEIGLILALFSIASSNMGCNHYSPLKHANFKDTMSSLKNSSLIGTNPSAVLRNFVLLCSQVNSRVQRGSVPVLTLDFVKETHSSGLSNKDSVLGGLNIQKPMFFDSELLKLLSQIAAQSEWELRKSSEQSKLSSLSTLSKKMYSLFLYLYCPYSIPLVNNDLFHETFQLYLQVFDFISKSFDTLSHAPTVYKPSLETDGKFMEIEKQALSKSFLDSFINFSLNELLRQLPVSQVYYSLVLKAFNSSSFSNSKSGLSNEMGKEFRFINLAYVNSSEVLETLLSLRKFMFKEFQIINISEDVIQHFPLDLRGASEFNFLAQLRASSYFFSSKINNDNQKELVVESFDTPGNLDISSTLLPKFLYLQILLDFNASLTELFIFTHQFSIAQNFQKHILDTRVNLSEPFSTKAQNNKITRHIHIAYKYFISEGLDITLEQLSHPLLSTVFFVFNNASNFLSLFTESVIAKISEYTSFVESDTNLPKACILIAEESEKPFKFIFRDSWVDSINKLTSLLLFLNKLFDILSKPSKQKLDIGLISSYSEELESKLQLFLETLSVNLLEGVLLEKTVYPRKDFSSPTILEFFEAIDSFSPKAMLKNEAFSSALEILVISIKRFCLSVKTGLNITSRNLWIHSHPTTLPTLSLRNLELRIVNLIFSLAFFGNHLDSKVLCLTGDFSLVDNTENLIQALATLYMISDGSFENSIDNNNNSLSLISNFEKLCDFIENKLKAISVLADSSSLSGSFESIPINFTRSELDSSVLNSSNLDFTFKSNESDYTSEYSLDSTSSEIQSKVLIFNPLSVIDRNSLVSSAQGSNVSVSALANLLFVTSFMQKVDSKIVQKGFDSIQRIFSNQINSKSIKEEILKEIFPRLYYSASADNLSTTSLNPSKQNQCEFFMNIKSKIDFFVSSLRLQWINSSFYQNMPEYLKSEKISSELSSYGFKENSPADCLPNLFISLESSFNDILSQNLSSNFVPNDLYSVILNPTNVIEDDFSITSYTPYTNEYISPSVVSQLNSAQYKVHWKWPLPTGLVNLSEYAVWTPSVFYLSHLSSVVPISIFGQSYLLVCKALKAILGDPSHLELLRSAQLTNSRDKIPLSLLTNENNLAFICLLDFIGSHISFSLNEIVSFLTSIFDISNIFGIKSHENKSSKSLNDSIGFVKSNPSIFEAFYAIFDLIAILSNQIGTLEEGINFISTLHEKIDSLQIKLGSLLETIIPFFAPEKNEAQYIYQLLKSNEVFSLNFSSSQTICYLSKLILIDSVLSFKESINLAYSLLNQRSSPNPAINPYEVCKSLALKGHILILVSVLYSHIPFDPIDPASYLQNLILWAKENMVSENTHYVLSSSTNLIFGKEANHQNLDSLFKSSDNISKSLSKLAKEEVFRNFGSQNLEISNTENNSNDLETGLRSNGPNPR
ncbi:hypothetical protein BB560_001040 [Smittium megazygosporum]|uniref:Midasin n=1 Tax=Smittium megazygosporum TaxID=133381 RepID=A0A2T9ZIR8_9FUNG|nr:hypothetical protein BB560_001040 [Smittium megazygosporum]